MANDTSGLSDLEVLQQGNDSSDENDSSDKDEEKETDSENDDESENEDDEESDDSDDKTNETDEEEEEKLEDFDDDEEEELVSDDSLYQKLKKYDAKIFNKNPELKQVIFREQEYSKIYPSVQEAKDAQEAAEILNVFERELTTGSSEKLFEALSNKGKGTLETFVANLPKTLQSHSKELYLEGIVYPVMKSVLRAAARHADPRMKASAENLNVFMFGDDDIAKEAGLKPKDSEKDTEFQKREQEWNQRKATEFTEDVVSTAEKRMKSYIGKQFANSGISALLQKTMTDEIARRVDEAISKDTRHMGNINALWKQAEKAGFTTEWKDRIKNTYLSRANGLIPRIRQTVLAEAKLGDKFKSVKDKTKDKVRIPAGNASLGKSGGKIDSSKVDWTKTSEEDYLRGKVTFKKE